MSHHFFYWFLLFVSSLYVGNSNADSEKEDSSPNVVHYLAIADESQLSSSLTLFEEVGDVDRINLDDQDDVLSLQYLEKKRTNSALPISSQCYSYGLECTCSGSIRAPPYSLT